MENKTFPWWKRSVDFEDQKLIRYMRKQENGDSLVLFYERLISYTANRDGVLSYDFGMIIKPYTPAELAADFGRPKEVVEKTLEILTEGGILEPCEINGQKFQRLADIDKLRGRGYSTKPAAKRARTSRANRKEEKDEAIDLSRVEKLYNSEERDTLSSSNTMEENNSEPFPKG